MTRRTDGLALLLLLLLAAGCGGPEDAAPPVHDGPIVLVTLGGVRAGAVGFLGGEPGTLTPHLDRLAAEADWAGAAVAPSSVGVVSLASFLTGLGPWAHGVGLGETPLRLPPELGTLAEAAAERGWTSAAYVPAWVERAGGWQQGFGILRDLGAGARAAGHLASLDGGRDLLWIHLGDAEAPYVRQDRHFDRLPPIAPDRLAVLPDRLSAADLEHLRDPLSPAGEAEREAVATIYRLAVAAADARLGELLAALAASGRREEALVVVVATHGQELVEPGLWGLARQHVEVPLVVDLPARLAARRQPLPPPGSRPAAARLWATLVEATGAALPPATAPSLFAAAPGGALSELYLGEGVNETSWVEGDLQLLRRVRFAPADAPIRRVRLARIGAAPAGVGAEAARARFDAAFAATPAWSGRDASAAETALVAWREGGVEPVDDPARRRAMAAAMERRRLAFTPCDESPGAAAAGRAAERAAALGEGAER